VSTPESRDPRPPSPDRLLAIIDLQNEIAGARMSLEGVMRVVVERASALTGASGAVVELVDADEMVYAATSGSAAESVGLRLRRDASLSGLCVAEKTLLRCDDAESDPRVDRDTCRRVGVTSMICVPLFHEASAVGVLKVLSQRRAAFSDEDGATLELLARIVAASMNHALAYESALHASLHDALTGLANRRAFETQLARELERHRRYGHPLSLVVLDLDGFKALNDRCGHAAGDDALRTVAAILRHVTRNTDACFRLGGDEFAILLPETALDAAALAVERIRADLGPALARDANVGISAGIVGAQEESAEDLVASADAALYADKEQRRRPASAAPAIDLSRRSA
jgi:diguanylate cyclase (GGDEF)-like protein